MLSDFNAWDYLPKKKWERAPAGYVQQTFGPGGRPKPRNLPDGRMVVDECRMADGSIEIAVFDNRDHAALALLPRHSPRSVKAVMLRENRVKHLRATDCSAFRDFEDAQTAWDKFSAAKMVN